MVDIVGGPVVVMDGVIAIAPISELALSTIVLILLDYDELGRGDTTDVVSSVDPSLALPLVGIVVDL